MHADVGSIRPGSRFGRYQINRLIARGGMGEVWMATAHGPNGFKKDVVVKTILPELAENPSYITMLINEASLAARLNHPNIVQVFDLGCVGGIYFIAMEFLPGRTLGQIVQRVHRLGERLPLWLSLGIVASCCDGLQYAHDYVDDQGRAVEVLHRDMSPSNVMLTFAGRVTILDFGIATANRGDGATQSGTIKGKYHYIPPERICSRPSDRRSDIYALGVVLYQLVTWTRPFEADNDYQLLRKIVTTTPPRPRERDASISPVLDEIIMTAMAPQADDRFPEASDLGRALRAFARAHGLACEQSEVADFLMQTFPDAPDLPACARKIAPLPPEPDGEPDIVIEGLPDAVATGEATGLSTIAVDADSIEIVAVEEAAVAAAAPAPMADPTRPTPSETSPFDTFASGSNQGETTSGDLFVTRVSAEREDGPDLFGDYLPRRREDPTPWPWGET